MNRELSKNESKMLKGVAILFMVCIHLFNRTELNGYYQPMIMVGNYPLIYYISFIFDTCVPIYCFCSGYGLYLTHSIDYKRNIKRLFKLLINFWIVVILTCVAGVVLKNPNIPGNICMFIKNILLISTSYVGAWWFMQTYFLLVITTPLIIKVIDHVNKYFILFVTLILYFIAYYFRIMHPIPAISPLVLYGTSLLPFVIGMMFYKYKIITWIRNKCICQSKTVQQNNRKLSS